MPMLPQEAVVVVVRCFGRRECRASPARGRGESLFCRTMPAFPPPTSSIPTIHPITALPYVVWAGSEVAIARASHEGNAERIVRWRCCERVESWRELCHLPFLSLIAGATRNAFQPCLFIYAMHTARGARGAKRCPAEWHVAAVPCLCSGCARLPSHNILLPPFRRILSTTPSRLRRKMGERWWRKGGR